MSTKSAITLRDLTFEWPDGTVAISGANGSRGTGRTGLIGRNDAGKSTLLRLDRDGRMHQRRDPNI